MYPRARSALKPPMHRMFGYHTQTYFPLWTFLTNFLPPTHLTDFLPPTENAKFLKVRQGLHILSTRPPFLYNG